MLQDGMYQCPCCDGPMDRSVYDSYGICLSCVEGFRQSPAEYRVQGDCVTVLYDEQLDIERMEDEGGPVSGEKEHEQ
jgi:hypothetical protein